ncbi:E3 ubiquitin-protein ligase makorin-1 [Elysia marginata]|uniref:RING-type E3 ubiquitin transferase n=1 Tax=Elysia marginata TaxID=1093978 RepID=A0AAV4IB85_9GAST|nr:E3 ubiquitin-protein ligase makorin-1 [Elysia marginata]
MLSKFGILQNCNHCFCLTCIRQWRTTEGGAGAMQKSCPVCRTPSEFIVPSDHWIETHEEKKKFIENFKKVFKSKPCRFFSQGEGFCLDGTECPYLHALPDGTEVEGNDYDYY